MSIDVAVVGKAQSEIIFRTVYNMGIMNKHVFKQYNTQFSQCLIQTKLEI